MIKHYFFHRVTEQELETMGTDGLFEFAGSYWFYKMEVTYDGDYSMVRIYDTVGRMMPFDITSLDTLMGAVVMVETVAAAISSTDDVASILDSIGMSEAAEDMIETRDSRISDMGFVNEGIETLVYPDGSILQA